MVAHITTVAFLGLEARTDDVQVQIAHGVPAFRVVGLPDKAVGESRDRVHATLSALGLALPPKRITVNLSPADRTEEHTSELPSLMPNSSTAFCLKKKKHTTS